MQEQREQRQEQRGAEAVAGGTDQRVAGEKVRELLGQFDTAMLVTRTAAGELRARPMMIAEAVQGHFDEGGPGDGGTGDGGTLVTFITSTESGKVDEIRTDSHVAITMQGGTSQRSSFMSITGWAELDRTPEEIDRLYSKVDDVWFEGPRDPRIALIRVRVHTAEYWDQREGIRFAWETMKAVAQGKSKDLSDERSDRQHGVLQH